MSGRLLGRAGAENAPDARCETTVAVDEGAHDWHQASYSSTYSRGEQREAVSFVCRRCGEWRTKVTVTKLVCSGRGPR